MFNATISACEKGQQWERALQVLEETWPNNSPAKKKCFTFIHVAFSIALCHTWNHHDPEEHNWPNPFPALRRLPSLVFCPISSVWESSMALSASFSLEGWGHDHQTATQLRSNPGAAATACERGSHWQGAEWLLTSLQQRMQKPDVAALTNLTSAWIGCNYWGYGLVCHHSLLLIVMVNIYTCSICISYMYIHRVQTPPPPNPPPLRNKPEIGKSGAVEIRLQ